MRLVDVDVHAGDVVIPERPPSAFSTAQVGLLARADFPRMTALDPDSLPELVGLGRTVQEREPRAVLAPWFVHTCHGRVATVDVADCRGNLVVRYTWDAGAPPVYSVFGTRDLDRAVPEILAGILENGDEPVITQVSAWQANILRGVPGLRIEPEHGRDEYVLDAARHAALDGHAYKRIRHAIHHVMEQAQGTLTVRMVDPADVELLATVRSALAAMPSSSEHTGNDADAWENACLTAYLDRPLGWPISVFLIEIAGEICGVGVFEQALGHDAVVFHVMRTDSRYEGLLDFGVWVLADAAARAGLAEVNLEEDLGLDGLRQKKEHCHPARMIRHFTVRPEASEL